MCRFCLFPSAWITFLVHQPPSHGMRPVSSPNKNEPACMSLITYLMGPVTTSLFFVSLISFLILSWFMSKYHFVLTLVLYPAIVSHCIVLTYFIIWIFHALKLYSSLVKFPSFYVLNYEMFFPNINVADINILSLLLISCAHFICGLPRFCLTYVQSVICL